MTDRTVTIHPTRDAAIAQCAAELGAEGGGEVIVHRDGCRYSPEVECSCSPTVYTVQAAVEA